VENQNTRVCSTRLLENIQLLLDMRRCIIIPILNVLNKVRLNKYNTEMMEQNIDFRIIDVIHQRFNDDKMREIFYEYSEIYINQNMEKIKKEILSNDIIQLIIDEINRRQIK
jgi:hypothetical protein